MLIAPEKHQHLKVFVRQIGSFVPQNVFALAEEALHGGTERHRRVVPHKKFGQNWLKDIKFKSNLYVA